MYHSSSAINMQQPSSKLTALHHTAAPPPPPRPKSWTWEFKLTWLWRWWYWSHPSSPPEMPDAAPKLPTDWLEPAHIYLHNALMSKNTVQADLRPSSAHFVCMCVCVCAHACACVENPMHRRKKTGTSVTHYMNGTQWTQTSEPPITVISQSLKSSIPGIPKCVGNTELQLHHLPYQMLCMLMGTAHYCHFSLWMVGRDGEGPVGGWVGG